jgi:hypothetical protein
MTLKAYKHELMILMSLLVLFLAFFYKQNMILKQNSQGSESIVALQDIKESIALKALWGDKKMTKTIETLKHGISPSKFKWTKRSKKLSATFTNISAKNLNAVLKKVMNLAVEIQLLNITKSSETYTMELKCKW